ncbi:ABC transporter ATP-binding protein [Meiothermus ruber]|jgi:branched-chain amino acid transport system ATP-binding protein|uniref:ABC transporter n=2 Tax=Meiothermus ruber TaxID=277 RepID=D3PSK6_MEIRD|nr:ABC transporter ATP-binding protein [Meiothermus ruber]GIW30989.1 MAG: ABC transporter ATP-binding protein [Meiothermus sp.]ADD28439.1 ABC transporter related protein [Meiothermus ruber DSM 1279]AGK06120.1 ABC transporter [Meiothermus ruber DSM 1279]MCL6528956.1 ABC transporter ATP-binding protein [Meiothermus ruber]MCX7801569.1 ABC transporter ATP-binding protein [Meiothermus ruber]
MLSVQGLCKRFGGVTAANEVSLQVAPGEILAVIGPNGAGKSTLLNLLSGLLRPDEGRIEFLGQEITHAPPEVRTWKGLGRAFQIVQPFPEMSVWENLLVGALYGKPSTPRKVAERVVAEVIELTGLAPKAQTPAGELTLLEDKRLELARALCTQPRLLLLDEVMAGLRPSEALEAVALVRRIRDSGVTVLFIEHLMPVVRALADRVVVMDYGRVIAEGPYDAVAANPKVREAYLGRAQ